MEDRLILHYTPTLNESPSLLEEETESLQIQTSNNTKEPEWTEKKKKVSSPEPENQTLKFSRTSESKPRPEPEVKRETKELKHLPDFPDSLGDFEDSSVLDFNKSRKSVGKKKLNPKSPKNKVVPPMKARITNEYWSDEDDFGKFA